MSSCESIQSEDSLDIYDKIAKTKH